MKKSYYIGHVSHIEGNTITIFLPKENKYALFFKDLDKQKIAKDIKIGEAVKVYTKHTMFGTIYNRAIRIK